MIYNGPELEWAISEYFEQGAELLESSPLFFRDWWMDTGWAECDHPDGHLLDSSMFIDSIKQLAGGIKGDVATATAGLLDQLLVHAREASNRSLSLRIYHS